jgi:hypothetical protein
MPRRPPEATPTRRDLQACSNCAINLPPRRDLPPFIGAGPDAKGHGGVLYERARLAMLDPEGEHDSLGPWPRHFDWNAGDWEPERIVWHAGAVAPLDGVRARAVLLHLAEPEGRPRHRVVVRPNGTPLDERAILERLGADLTKPRGMVQCPAHEDRAASLSWRWDGSRALLHCFAGCSFDQVRRAL